MKLRLSAFLGSLFLLTSFAHAQSTETIEDYYKQLPYWGTSWKPGAGAQNGYYPSFYTGFAPRQEAPERIHVRISRGNQLRVSVILDQQTLKDYLFDLVKRDSVYKTTVAKGITNIAPKGALILPQLAAFQGILNSKTYDIKGLVAQNLSDEQLVAQALKVLSELNPGRVFPLKIDLKAAFAQWKQENTKSISGDSEALIAINSLVFGRINYVEKPSAELLAQLNAAIKAGQSSDEKAFEEAALTLFKTATGDKYAIKVIGASGQFEDAIQCSTASCTLSYPEFTAIYPMGSAVNFTKDKFGNKITNFTTPGLWPFVKTASHDVDNIRQEPYYGWIPKMDYQATGNGFHNPAVRFNGVNLTSSIKKALSVPMEHDTLWAVKRGGVSHGCSRLPAGAVWELRAILPVESSKINEVYYFGNNSLDFDVYDIDGDGKLEVMGVEYMISYNVQGSGLQSREGADLEVSSDRKLDFYNTLYGARSVFTVNSQGTYIFSNPGVSMPSYLDLQKVGVKVRLSLSGDYPLYEQTYEKDKIQLYQSPTMDKKLIRLMGRIRGCAPSSDKTACGAAAFEKEAGTLVR